MPDTDHYERVIAHITPAFSDDRGDISNILSGIPIKHIAIITSVQGAIRGNHFHPGQDQYIYILSGRLLSWSYPIADWADIYGIHAEEARAGDLLYCPEKVAHAYYALEPTVFLNIDTEPRGEYEKDTLSFPLMAGGEDGRPTTANRAKPI